MGRTATAPRPGSVPSREVMTTVAGEIASLICAYRTQRPRLGRAHLRQQLHDHPQQAGAGCEIVKDVLNRVLDSNGCSVFTVGVGPRESCQLYFATTTGIEPGPPDVVQRGNDAAERCYDLTRDPGYTTFVARHPGIAVRKNDVINENEQGVPAGFPAKPLDKIREKFALSKLDRRRFLGIGVAHDERLLGVVRLNRASTSRPYTRCDAELLEALVDLDECKCALNYEQKQQRIRREQAAAGARRSKPLVSAVVEFLQPAAIPDVGSVRKLVDQLLQSLLVLFQEDDVEQAGVLVHPRDTVDCLPRWYARQHSGSTRRLPTPESWEAEISRRSWAAGERILTFDSSFIPSVAETGRVIAAGVRVPVIAWTGRRQLRWQLAMDFRKAVRWDDAHFELLFHAVQKLAAMLGHSDYVIRAEGLRGKTSQALAQFVALTREDAGIRSDGAALRFYYRPQIETVYESGTPLPPTDEKEWDSIGGDETGVEASAFGVKQWRGGGAWSIPLRLGPFAMGDLRCKFTGQNVLERRDKLIQTLPVLWSRLTCELQTPFGKQPVRFTAQPGEQGWTFWHEELQLPRLNFTELEGQARSADLFARL